MRLFAIVCVAALAVVTVLGCKDDVTSPTPVTGVPFSKVDLRLGTGTEAAAGKRLTVNYTGWLYSTSATDNKGAMFDTSTGRGSFTFVLGAGSVIAGWEQGLVGMKAGGLRRLVIPPDLAYGSSSVGSIPANSTLVFDIELVSAL